MRVAPASLNSWDAVHCFRLFISAEADLSRLCLFHSESHFQPDRSVYDMNVHCDTPFGSDSIPCVCTRMVRSKASGFLI